MTALRQGLRAARRGIWYVVATGLMAMALVAGVTSQLLPLAEHHPERIAAWLSARTGRNVTVDSIKATWTRRGPLLRVQGLRVGTGTHTVPIGEAEILVSQYTGLLPGHAFTELRLRHLDLTIEQGDDGRWHVRGLPGQQLAGQDPLTTLEGLGELQVIGARVSIIAPALELNATVPKIDMRLLVNGDRVRVGARAWMPTDPVPMDVAMDFSRKRGNGRLYAGTTRANLAAWSTLLRLDGIVARAGSGRAAAWADLRAHRVAAVTLDVALENVHLSGAPLPQASGSQSIPQAKFADVQAQARWQLMHDGWRVIAPRLRIQQQQLQILDGLVVIGGRNAAVRGKRIDAAPLLQFASLSHRVNPGLRAWLAAATPHAVLRNVAVTTSHGVTRAHAEVQDAGFAAIATRPGLGGLSGRIDADNQGFSFAFDRQQTLRFDWRVAFGQVHTVKVQGMVAGWRDGNGWNVATPALRIDGVGYGADLRGGLWFQGDGTRPLINLAARVDDSALATAKKFWVRHRMPPAAVQWLDTALISGRVQGGRALVVGDLDDWPFQQADAQTGGQPKGLFQADAHIADGMLKFHPQWPAVEQLDVDTSFAGNGFTVTGRGSIGGVDVAHFDSGVADYRHADLTVHAKTDSEAGKLLTLLRHSPLWQQYNKPLAKLVAKGPATVSFAMDKPLRSNAPPPTVSGEVDLRGAALSHGEWQLAFNDVRGTLHYDQFGFNAQELAVLHEAQPGKLSLRAGAGHVRDAAKAFEGDLQASIPADALLDHAPQLAWLKPRIEGRSPWTIAVFIPKANATSKTNSGRLRLSSNLVGTSLDLPAPLDKAASEPLATTIETALPYGAGEVAVAFGDRLGLRMHTAPQAGIRAVLGSQRVAEAPPASGLILTGRTDSFDALGWAALGSGDRGEGLALRRIDVFAERMQLIGSIFPETRLQVIPAPNGMAIQFDGPALSGSLLRSSAANAGISGKLQRLFWRNARPADKSMTKLPAPELRRQQDELDPADIPALNLAVDELRFGDAQLGRASLRTHPIADGMRIEQFRSDSPQQRLQLDGDWRGRDVGARTRLNAVIDSDDFGSLLQGFGVSSRMDGGHGEVKLNIRWPGSPATFNVAAVDGSLSIIAKEGRLTGIEPGAGRVLGLLSIAELPRRLTLDFRDFFAKGFAFNRIEGKVAFAAGKASSDNLSIDGPAALIRISGAANLREQSFNQTIEVFPKAGNLLTAVGAIAGGPVGAAVGAVANAVLQKPLGEVAAKTYRVTGPWADPKVEVVTRTQGHARNPAALPAG